MSSCELAQKVRRSALEMVHAAKASHIGGALSMADALAVLYSEVLHVDPTQPNHPDRDRFILSKGHSCSAVYAVLAHSGFFPVSELTQYGTNNSRLMAHISHKVPGVEFSTGSLGHGLPFGCGKALAAKRRGEPWRTFVLLSDGELDEGSNWESFLFAPQHHLDNLVVLIDYNRIQSLGSIADIMELEPLAKKLEAFRWAVREVDGHDHHMIANALKTLPWRVGVPSCLILHTVKGKGVSFMENQLKWHYSSPSADQLADALTQLEAR